MGLETLPLGVGGKVPSELSDALAAEHEASGACAPFSVGQSLANRHQSETTHAFIKNKFRKISL